MMTFVVPTYILVAWFCLGSISGKDQLIEVIFHRRRIWRDLLCWEAKFTKRLEIGLTPPN